MIAVVSHALLVGIVLVHVVDMRAELLPRGGAYICRVRFNASHVDRLANAANRHATRRSAAFGIILEGFIRFGGSRSI